MGFVRSTLKHGDCDVIIGVPANYEQAAASFEKVLELDPDLRLMPLPQPLFWSHLTTNLMASGRIGDAIGYLDATMMQIPARRKNSRWIASGKIRK